MKHVKDNKGKLVGAWFDGDNVVMSLRCTAFGETARYRHVYVNRNTGEIMAVRTTKVTPEFGHDMTAESMQRAAFVANERLK